DESHDESDYAAAIRLVRGGLVAAVEEGLGLLIENPDCFERVCDEFVASLPAVQAWQDLYDLLLNAVEDAGDYDRAAVLELCDRPLLLEAFHASVRRVERVPRQQMPEVFDRVIGRIRQESAAEVIRQHRETVRNRSSDEAEAFAKILEASRKQASVVPLEYRLREGGGQ
ncbi:MAG: hypothetical protein AB7N71_09570, partial [Phycisphaerae bacterium]